jgi:hypothetical protein
VFLINAERYELLKAVAAFFQKLRDLLRSQHRGVVEHDVAIEILGEANMRRARKTVEDFAPSLIRCSAPAMVLVHHDQVEKLLPKLLGELLPMLRPGNRLIESEIDLEAGVDAPLLVERQCQIDHGAVLPIDRVGVCLEFSHSRKERTEIVHHRLVN